MIFRKDYGFDLGTTYMHICHKDKGVVLNEPEVIAFDQKNKSVVAVGNTAYDMFEKTPGTIKINMPIQYGVIADFDNMISLLEQQCKRLKLEKGSTALVCSPYHISEVEKKALFDLFTLSKVRFKSVFMLDKPLAAGIGCGINVLDPKGNLIIDIGGGTTEISVISLGGVVISDLLKIGGDKFDINIKHYVKRKYNVLIGLRTAERIKIKITGSRGDELHQSIQVIGRDILSGLPQSINVTAQDVAEAIKEDINTIIEAVKSILEKTPPELSSDILEAGIYLSGGSSNILNIGNLIEYETSLDVHVSENPENCVINGIYHILNNYNKHKHILFSHK